MAHQYMPKILYDPHKNSPAPPSTYLTYGPSGYRLYKGSYFPKRAMLNILIVYVTWLPQLIRPTTRKLVIGGIVLY